MSVAWTATERNGVRIVEASDAPLMRSAGDINVLFEACYSHNASAAILYPANLTSEFFDLSSGHAGALLQKLSNYRVRMALVCAPGAVRFSSRFGEMAVEERRNGHFAVCETVEEARAWLAG